MTDRSAGLGPDQLGLLQRTLAMLGTVLGHMLWLGALLYLLVASGLHLADFLGLRGMM